LMDTYNIPVWNTEAGAWDLGFYQGVNSNFASWGKTVWPHTDAVRYYEGTIGAASLVTENYSRTIATGESKYFYYDSRYYAAANYFKHHPTILEYDGTVRAKGITYAIAGSLIDHSVGLGNASSDPNSFFLVFDKPTGPVAALFTADNQPRQVTISLSSGQLQGLDMMGNPLPGGNIFRYGRIPIFLKGIGMTAAALKTALQSAVISSATDTTPPNLSISDAPRGPIADHNFRVRWIAIDDSSYPNLGEVNPVTNTAGPPNPNAIVYSYILNGYSASWSNWSAATYVDFANVPSGTYTFSVVSKDAAGNQSAVVNRTIVIN
jgi:Y_Y_Y domain